MICLTGQGIKKIGRRNHDGKSGIYFLSHGINDIQYITGESRNKKHPELIFHIIKDNLLPSGLDATGIWDFMRLTLEKSKKVKNSVIHIEVSPAPEHTKDFTIDDWRRLWDDFMGEFDNIELLDKNGKTYSPKTKAARARCGCIWNPREAFPIFTARSAVSTNGEMSTTTMTYTCEHSGQPGVWPCNGAGRPPPRCGIRTSGR